MKLLITDDMFDIVGRLKQIDPTYFVMWNTEAKRFEVHSSACHPTLCLVLPYDTLDARTLHKVRITRVENYTRLIEQMDKNNQQLNNKLHNTLTEQVRYQLHDIYTYSNSTSKEFNCSNAYRNKWA